MGVELGLSPGKEDRWVGFRISGIRIFLSTRLQQEGGDNGMMNIILSILHKTLLK
jgi:hypothetical protein